MENSGAGVSKPSVPGGEIDLGQIEVCVGGRLGDGVERSITIGSMNHGSQEESPDIARVLRRNLVATLILRRSN
ncbi:unnamed protein product [Cuscuta campestris]|uniref:Uncharacterized protein n=1 Tax=Cuscuta campestris TaxID=132261 RepID=A0A484NK92_9ASTE|nr:unnamed protein product [Cuscuta campestris]